MGLDDRVRCCPDGLMTDRRHNVRVLDATIRDGGCCNAWQFSHDFVGRTFDALLASGVDIMEIGYLTSPGVYDTKSVGPWRFCDEDDLARVARPSRMKLAAMVDVGRIRPEDLRPAGDSLISVIRVATYGPDIAEAVDLLHAARELGYETFCNVMAVTECTPQEVDSFLAALHDSRVENVAVVDSFGALYPHQLRYLIRKYKNWLRPEQHVGVHLHNNQQQAFANTIAAIEEGVDFVDGTIFGMGRGAGNCPLELLLMYLDDPRHDVRPILAMLEEYDVLRDELRWGYQAPYAITGWLNRHPREAIARVQTHRGRAVEAFWEQLTKDAELPRNHRPQLHPES